LPADGEQVERMDLHGLVWIHRLEFWVPATVADMGEASTGIGTVGFVGETMNEQERNR
jgi:hypothetical protein